MNGVRTHTFSGDMHELHRQLKIQLPYDDDHDGPLLIEETGTFLLYMIYLPRRQLWDFSNSHYRMNLRYTLKLSFENKRLNILGVRFRIEITVCCVIYTLEFVMRWDLPPFPCFSIDIGKLLAYYIIPPAMLL